MQAFEKIRSQVDAIIEKNLVRDGVPAKPYEIGTVPNLFSLIPMAQSSHKPVFELIAKDGVVGAHFAKVKDAKEIFGKVAVGLAGRISQ